MRRPAEGTKRLVKLVRDLSAMVAESITSFLKIPREHRVGNEPPLGSEVRIRELEGFVK